MKSSQSFLILFCIGLIASCTTSSNKIDSKSTEFSSRLSSEYLSSLVYKFSGKSYDDCPGEYKGGKTYALFLDKENWPFSNEIVTSELQNANLLATDSTRLNTVVLIYANSLPLRLINGKQPSLRDDGFQICFVDKNSMCIKKVVSLKCSYEYPEMYHLIAAKIIKEF